MTTKRAWNG